MCILFDIFVEDMEDVMEGFHVVRGSCPLRLSQPLLSLSPTVRGPAGTCLLLKPDQSISFQLLRIQLHLSEFALRPLTVRMRDRRRGIFIEIITS